MDRAVTILLADRSRGTLMFTEKLLRDRGRTIHLAEHGATALQLARFDAPRLIVLGFQLGDMNAPEFCRAIRADETTRRTSLLLIADPAERNAADLCLAAGCNDLLYRPLHQDELNNKVTRLLQVPQRRDVRTLAKLEIRDRQALSLLGHTVNLSASGMLLRVDRMLPPSARVQVQFFLSGDRVPIRVDSEVVRAEFTGGMPRYGIRFLNIAAEVARRIDSFVQRAAKGETAANA